MISNIQRIGCIRPSKRIISKDVGFESTVTCVARRDICRMISTCNSRFIGSPLTIDLNTELVVTFSDVLYCQTCCRIPGSNSKSCTCFPRWVSDVTMESNRQRRYICGCYRTAKVEVLNVNVTLYIPSFETVNTLLEEGKEYVHS